jgi:site-specific recombinase XerD
MAVAADAEINKHVTTHLLRYGFVTHLLEQKFDFRLIQVLLSHGKLESTGFYAQVAINALRE